MSACGVEQPSVSPTESIIAEIVEMFSTNNVHQKLYLSPISALSNQFELMMDVMKN
jgi:hypothetical protein